MMEHHIQKELLHKLVFVETARFSDLRPRDVDSNVITYHLQQLLKQNLVVKNDDGTYSLTEQGKIAGTTITLTNKELLQQAHPVLLLALKVGNRWLLRRRKAQPMLDKIGFVHCEPVYDQRATETAAFEFEKRTGLQATFSPKGSGYIKFVKNGELVSFTSYTLLVADSFEGKLAENLGNGQNNWYDSPDFSSAEMIPSMQDIVSQFETTGLFFFENTYEVF